MKKMTKPIGQHSLKKQSIINIIENQLSIIIIVVDCVCSYC